MLESGKNAGNVREICQSKKVGNMKLCFENRIFLPKIGCDNENLNDLVVYFS